MKNEIDRFESALLTFRHWNEWNTTAEACKRAAKMDSVLGAKYWSERYWEARQQMKRLERGEK